MRIDRIAAESCNQLATRCALGTPLTVVRLSRRVNSEIYRVSDGTITIAVKNCVHRALAQAEFDALSRVHARIPNSVPAPLAKLPNSTWYAMNWVDGKPLTRLLTQGPPALRGIAAAGNWLRRFHNGGAVGLQVFDLSEKLTVLDQWHHGGALFDDNARAAFAWLKNHARALDGAPVTVSWVHGDFKADNILMDGAKVVGIDVQLGHENAIGHDLASFQNHLALLRYAPRTAWSARREAGAFDDAFKSGYGTLSEVDKVVAHWLRVYTLLSARISTQREARGGLTRRLQWRIRDFALRGLVQSLLEST